MNTYQICIPAFTRYIIAHNRKEALELFWFEYDNAQALSEREQPSIELIKPKSKST